MNYILLKELMKQSETECGFDSNKFAELIVRECVDCLDKQHVDIPEDADLNDIKTWTSATMNSTINMCVGKVKKHFGVEE